MIYDAFENGLSKDEKIAPSEERELGGFKTLSETVELSLRVKDGSGILRIYGINKSGVKSLWREDRIEGELSFVFDPISLSVYSGYDSFAVKVIGGEKGLELLTLSVNEKRESDIGTAQVLRATKKHPIPNKVLIAGNSLLLGMENSFGMCSSAPDKDYFHHLSTYICKFNPGCVFNKLHISGYEHSESVEAFEKWWGEDENVYTKAPSKLSFTDDIDLIILQFGDNINTEAKFATFKADGDTFIERIKSACPKARIIVVNAWYNREPVFSDIVKLCEKHGIERVDIRDLRKIENEARDLKEFLSKDGSMKPVKETWITHPGDNGMRLIGEKIAEYLAF
jgi:hypothetical protein